MECLAFFLNKQGVTLGLMGVGVHFRLKTFDYKDCVCVIYFYNSYIYIVPKFSLDLKPF